MSARDPMRVRCHARNRHGKPCGKSTIPGGTVCHYHGGAAPQVKAAAERRLALLVLPAIGKLGKLMQQGKHLPTSLGAVKDILDRAGLKAVEGGSSSGTPTVVNLQINFVKADGTANNGNHGNGRLPGKIAIPV